MKRLPPTGVLYLEGPPRINSISWM